jgi:MYXO-CTERM domain-containing protein
MKRAALALGIGAAVVSVAVVHERRAAACGGCFTPPTQTASDVTDERMLLSVSTLQTTLYDQIRYAGTPSSFAWVLPIHGTVDVGLSADVLFDSVDVLTQTQIQAPPLNCPVPIACQGNFGGSSGSGSGGGGFAAADASAGPPGVTVIKAQNVGPYATVQLATNGDPTALNTWLATNGFNIPADVVPTLDAYVREGFDFLAMKLLPDQGVQSMRPVRVTTSGASLSLPLRMAAIGTGATVGITIWVVGDGRYEPQNFPFFHIEDASLVWDFSTSSSNYTTLRQQYEQALGGKGWEIESSISLGEDLVSNVILSGGTYYGYGYGPGGYPGAGTADAGGDYLPTTSADGGIAETSDQVRADDIKTLFAGMAGPSVRVTRIRSDISHAAMTTDFVLQASQDQSALSNVRQATQSINEQCPIYGPDCSIIGNGTPAQAAASGPPSGGIGGIWGYGGNGMTGGSMFGSSSGSVGGGGNGGKASGCSTTTTEGSSGFPVGLVAIAGVLGLASLRARRARRDRAAR